MPGHTWAVTDARLMMGEAAARFPRGILHLRGHFHLPGAPGFAAAGERGEPGRCCPAPWGRLSCSLLMSLCALKFSWFWGLWGFQPLPSPSEPGAGTGVAVMEGEVKQQSFVEVGILSFLSFPRTKI